MLRIAATLALMAALIGGSATYAVWRGQVPMVTEVAGATEPAPGPSTERPKTEEAPELLGVVVPTMEVTVSAGTEARIEAITVAMGQPVRAGERLATIDTGLARHDLRAMQARKKALEAQRRQVTVERSAAEDRRDRGQRLGAVVPEQERQQQQFEVDAAEARLQQTRAEIAEIRAQIDKLERLIDEGHVVAPFDGVIARRHVDPGARVAAGEPIVDLMSQTTQVRLAAPASLAIDLRPADVLSARCEGAADVDQVIVERVAPQLDAASRMILVEGRLAGGTAAVGTVCRLSASPP